MSSSEPPLAQRVIDAIDAWAWATPEIRALALVGSHAHGKARPDSDVDFVALCEDPAAFRSDAWIGAVPWPDAQTSPASWRDIRYGVLWGRHFRLVRGLDVELSFAPLDWAAIDPVDSGTRRVVSDRCRALHDPDGLVGRRPAATARA